MPRRRCATRDPDGALRITCPAKVNLTLEVRGRRPDGYHELRSVIVPISLSDSLTLRVAPEPGIRLTVEGAALPSGRDNLVYRAADLMLDAVGEAGPASGRGRADRASAGSEGIGIHLIKRVPVAAGLGGGSSDAASTLVGLNRLLSAGLSTDALADLALRLGADVPFFLLGRPALATGIGERLTPLPPIPTLWMVLLNPGFAVSTAWVFEEFARASARDAMLTPSSDQATIAPFVTGPAAAGRALRNDLEHITLRAHPQLRTLKTELEASGAVGTAMSGSGPTIFGIFLDERAARQSYERVRRNADCLAFVACST